MNILITGACGGMGRAACDLLTREGHTVFGLDVREPDSPVTWCFLKTDLTSETAVTETAARLRAEGVKLHAILHHAGMYDLDSLVELSDEAMRRIFDVNFFAMARANRLFLPLLDEHAKIVVTSSELAPLDPLPFTGLYAVTKAAVEKYAFSLRMELQLLGRSVVVLRPGAVRTSLLDVSTARLDAFCEHTALYECNAKRFRKIVNSVEARSVPPEKVAALDSKILHAKRPRYVYSLNRNPLLLLLNALPDRLQNFILRMILK